MTILYLDIETNLNHDEIWCAGWNVDGLLAHVTRDSKEVQRLVNEADHVVGHNIIGFDAPVLEKVWGVKIPTKKLIDTLVLSRLWNPSMDGGHSLDAWGSRLKMPKGDFKDYDAGYTKEMHDYCLQDVAITVKLHKYLVDHLDDDGFTPECRDLERQVAVVIEEQRRRGVTYDLLGGMELEKFITDRMRVIEDSFQVLFPPVMVERVSEKTGKPLKPVEVAFNVSSRQQIADKLTQLGYGSYLTAKTETGKHKIDETVLASIPCEEAQLISEYLTLQKRQGMLAQWNKLCTRAGKIHGRIITNGAVTGRMTHATPNLAQVPSCGSYLGKECRALFRPSPGKVMVGIDASALELCMLAHYMKDDEFTKAVAEGRKEDGTDVHTLNQHKAGLPSRDAAKTFIYALCYGAGAGKIGSIIDGGAAEGGRMMAQFMAGMPKFQVLKDKVDRLVQKDQTLPGLDGRVLRVRSAHSALNTLLQGAGAVVMKKALIIFYMKLRKAKHDVHFLLNVHDEIQLECSAEIAEVVGQMGVDSIREAGEHFNMRCPLTGEYKVGKSWEETH